MCSCLVRFIAVLLPLLLPCAGVERMWIKGGRHKGGEVERKKAESVATLGEDEGGWQNANTIPKKKEELEVKTKRFKSLVSLCFVRCLKNYYFLKN